MRTSLTVFSLLATVTFLVVQSCYQQAFTNVLGAPAARAGSPFEGNFTCNLSGCHNSYPLGSRPGWITSNIPGGGYIPGQTYTITATATSANCVRFGFEITPQTSTGVTAGTAIITNAAQTKFVVTGNPRWITHTQAGTSASPSGSKTWTFDWTAPVSGTGTVTFYGAFNRANNLGTPLQDSIFTSTLVVAENPTAIWDSEPSNVSFNVYPVPARENIFIRLKTLDNYLPEIQLTDISGKIIRSISDAGSSTFAEHTFDISTRGMDSGIYFIRIIHGSAVSVKKVIVL